MSLAQSINLAEGLPGVSPGVYNASDFHAVAEIVYGEAGIVLAEGKAMLVYSRLAPLVRRTGCGTFGNFIARVREDEEERAAMVAALTTNHTFFYREAHHFEHFANDVRPDLAARLGLRQPVRIWSAGCSSGEETWSLAMTLLGAHRQEGVNLAAATCASWPATLPIMPSPAPPQPPIPLATWPLSPNPCARPGRGPKTRTGS